MHRRTFLATLFGGVAAAGLGITTAEAAPATVPAKADPAAPDTLATAVDATDAEFSQYRRRYRRRHYRRRGPHPRRRGWDRRARPDRER